jgi:hypothetical protein
MSATISVPSSDRWLARLLSGRPHQLIGPPDRPYLLRWFVIPPNRWCNIYWPITARGGTGQISAMPSRPQPRDWVALSVVALVCGAALISELVLFPTTRY